MDDENHVIEKHSRIPSGGKGVCGSGVPKDRRGERRGL